ncbi:hypothetical protein [Lelliottia sp. WAP21]|uniref:hypothetical protein n=1 Tax=Lelliottia sp. WAP21 TaxID=2877426 RepID=UPI001E4D6E57|nr:hypothetical protein [Lelliottia sp. WAP21]
MTISMINASEPVLCALTRIQSDEGAKISATPFSEKLQNIQQTTKTPHKSSNMIVRCIRNIVHFFASVRAHISQKNAGNDDIKSKNMNDMMQSTQSKASQNNPDSPHNILSSTTHPEVNTNELTSQTHTKKGIPVPPPLPTHSSTQAAMNSEQLKAPVTLADRLAQAKLNKTSNENAKAPETKPISKGIPLPPPLPPSAEVAMKNEQQNAPVTFADRLAQTKLNKTPTENAKASDSKIPPYMEELQQRFAKIFGANTEDKLTATGNNTTNKFSIEIAELRKAHNSEIEVQKREREEALLDARVKAAIEAEKKSAAAEIKNIQAESKPLMKGIPLPPPMPTAPLTTHVAKPVITPTAKKVNSDQGQTKDLQKPTGMNADMLKELNERLAAIKKRTAENNL